MIEVLIAAVASGVIIGLIAFCAEPWSLEAKQEKARKKEAAKREFADD